VHKRIISAVKRVEFVSDRMSYKRCGKLTSFFELSGNNNKEASLPHPV
jgi:hypothetical protein